MHDPWSKGQRGPQVGAPMSKRRRLTAFFDKKCCLAIEEKRRETSKLQLRYRERVEFEKRSEIVPVVENDRKIESDDLGSMICFRTSSTDRKEHCPTKHLHTCQPLNKPKAGDF